MRQATRFITIRLCIGSCSTSSVNGTGLTAGCFAPKLPMVHPEVDESDQAMIFRTEEAPHMRTMRNARVGLLAVAMLYAACAPQAAPTPAGAPSGQAAPAAATPPKTLNVVLVGEPRALTMWRETTTGTVIHIHEMLTNALIGQNARSEPIP